MINEIIFFLYNAIFFFAEARATAFKKEAESSSVFSIFFSSFTPSHLFKMNTLLFSLSLVTILFPIFGTGLL